MQQAPETSKVNDRSSIWRTSSEWIRKNLFNTWFNSLLTLVCLWLLGQGLKLIITWTTQAKWAVIPTNLPLFLVGRYPPELYGRLWLVLTIILVLVGLSWLIHYRFTAISQWILLVWVLSFPVILWLIGGGLGLKSVDPNLWNGLLLTLITALISMILSFPVGVLLALGRQSTLPVVRWGCLFYIEIIRGLPLIGILFIAQVMLPLLLPMEMRLDRVVRAIAGLTLFSAAYMAENVRGGLQAVPKGQVEAARSLGLNTPFVILLIVLPQALRIVIPAIVGQFIGLFKDTSLLSLFALLELTGIARSILAQPQFIGRYAEVYVFIGLIYWSSCYSLSLASRRLERQLGRGG